MEYGYCNICKKHLYSYSDYVIKNGKKICNDCNSKSQANSNQELEALVDYIKKIFHKEHLPESWNVYLDKMKAQGRTYSGMRGTLYYYYEILNNPVPYDSLSAIGIIDFVYEEAFRFFKEAEEVNEYNRNLKYQVKTNVVTLSEKPVEKSKINIEDL